MSRRPAALAVLAALLLAGCGVSLPSGGPVVETTPLGSNAREDTVIINPRGPGKGDTPEEIVRGFVEAMMATPPIKTSVAREFLTSDAREDWQPTGVVAYSTTTLSPLRGSGVVDMTLVDAATTDARGAWVGPLTGAAATFAIPLELEDDQWRISDPPDVLMVDRSWFERRLRQASLYFFDATGSLVVPEPVFAPRGVQFATTLVNALLQGPPPELATAELSFLPTGLRPVVSVPVSDDGVAQVDLISDAGDVPLGPPEAERLVAQLAWTLRQDTGISRFRVTIGGREVKLPNGESEFSVGHGSAFAPYVADASPVLYGVRDGLLVAGSPQSLEPVSGPLGQEGVFPLRSAALDMRADQAAGVSTGGTTLVQAPVDDDGTPRVLKADGVDLLDPAWDFRDRLWVVDRRPDGAVVQYFHGDSARTLEVPGISGEDVKAFAVSRDGTRIAAVVRSGPTEDEVVVSRLLTAGDVQVVRALDARVVTPPEFDGKVRDVAWRSPTGLVYLQPESRRLYQVRTASVDGASLGIDTPPVSLTGEVTDLVGSPTPSQPAYALAEGALKDLAGPRDQDIPLDPGVTHLSYVG